MLKVLFLLVHCCQVASPATHTLTVCFTGLLGEENWPEFVGVALVDGFEVVYCDSNTMTAESRQDWMKKHDPAYLNWFTNQCRETQRFFSLIIEQLMQNFNPTKGVHTFQRMLGCEFDDVTDEINGINQFGYDGEDFITFDLKTHTRIPAMQQAVIFKQRWDNDKAASAVIKNYLTQVCPEMLKMFVNYGRSFMLRTALLSVSLLQKSPSSPVTCHATGFSTNRVSMVWRKDGVELHEGVGKGDILPNDDGTFQMSVDLQVSSVRPEDWEGYDCVFQLSDVYKAIVTKLDKAVIRVNKVSHLEILSVIHRLKSPVKIVGGLVSLALLIIGCFIRQRKGNADAEPQPASAPGSADVGILSASQLSSEPALPET